MPKKPEILTAKSKGRLKARPTIGLLMAYGAEDPNSYPLWEGMRAIAQARGANLLCFPGKPLRSYAGFDAQANILYDLISKKNVDGLVSWGTWLSTYVDIEEVMAFYKHYHPLPIVNIGMPLEGIPSVFVNNYQGMRDAMAHLIEVHGYRRIAFIQGLKDNPEALERYRAYTDALDKYDIPFDENIVAPGDWKRESGALAMSLLLDAKVEFDAVVANNDMMALGVIEELQTRKFQVPKDVAVVGFDNARESKYSYPPLTTVRQSFYEFGKRATEMLLALLEGQQVDESVILPVKVITRQSCGCPHPEIEQVRAGITSRAASVPRMAIAASREEVLAEMLNVVANSPIADLSRQTGQVVNAFFAELGGESPGIFLSSLDETLRRVTLAGGEVLVWQDAISVMRRKILPGIQEQALFRAEDLWQQARVMIGERALRIEGQRRLQTEQRAATSSEISQALVTSSNMHEVMTVLCQGLPRLEIPGCYVSLYENPLSPTNGCRLILAYQDGRRLELEPDMQPFPSWQLAPEYLLPKDRAYNLIVEPLYFRENQQGIAVFEMGPQDEAVYQRLSGLLSSALWGATIASENAKHMKELEHLQQASEKLASVADVREVLQQIVESAHDVLQADSVAIWSYDAIRQDFLPDELVTQGIPQDLVEKSKLNKPNPGGTAEAVIREGYLAVSDVNDSKYEYLGPPQVHGLRGAIGVKSFQGIVLKVGAEVLGVLYVNYKVSRGFDDEEKSMLATFAYHAALALKKARLLEQVRRAYDTATVVAEVSAQEDLQSTLNAIANGTLDAFQCDAITLNSYNQATNQLSYPPAMAGINYPERVQRSKGKVETNSIIYEMLQREEPYLVDVIAQNADLKDRRFVKDEEIKSCLAIRLEAASQKVGVMFVNYRTYHHFTSQEIDAIKLFAYQAAVAIRNAQLHDEATRKTQYLQALYQAGTAVTSTLSLDQILERIVEQVRLITGSNGEPTYLVRLGLIEGTKLEIKAWRSDDARGPQEVVNIDLVQDTPIGIMGRAVKTGESILRKDATQDKDYIAYDPMTHSELAVPIKLGRKVIGVINVEHPDYGVFDEVDQQVLESLATQVAIAIENARYVEEIRQRALQMQTASEVARDAASILNIGQLLDQAVNLISARFPFYHTAIFLLEKEYVVLKAASSYGGQKMLDERHKLKVGDGIPGRVASTGEPRIALDVDKDVDFLRNHYLPDTRSEMALPLDIHGQRIGVLDVQSVQPNAFTKEDITTLQMMADQLAIAIHNAQQYEELKQTKGLVGASTALAWMGMASSAWRHTIDKHARTIAEQVDLLRRELTQMLQIDHYSQVNERLSMIQRLARQIEEKPIAPPLSSEEGAGSVAVNALIRERIERLWESEPYKSVTLELDLSLNDGLTVRASPEWLRRALDILINNAIEAMIDSSDQQIAIKTRQWDKWLDIQIRDTGKGIPDEVRRQLFIDRIEKVKGARGLGVGLLMAQVIVQTYGGDIGVASTGPTGTTMFVRLPLEP